MSKVDGLVDFYFTSQMCDAGSVNKPHLTIDQLTHICDVPEDGDFINKKIFKLEPFAKL